MSLEYILFFILAFIAVATAVGMIFSKNAVYAALHLVTNFIAVAIFYLLLDSPFIALSQVTVYAGAIMVLFLFVIMLLGVEKIRAELTWKDLRVQVALALILLAQGVYLVLQRAGLGQPVGEPGILSNPSAMSEQLFTTYLLPFEVTSVLLLVAMVGAIVLTKREKKV